MAKKKESAKAPEIHEESESKVQGNPSALHTEADVKPETLQDKVDDFTEPLPEQTSVKSEKKNTQVSIKTFASDKQYITEVLESLLKTNEHATMGDALHHIIETARNPHTITVEKEVQVEKVVEKPVIEWKEKEVIREVEKELEANQAIFSFTPEVQKIARLIRPFMRKDGTLKSSDPDTQLSELINTAVKYFARHKYDNIINPL